MEKKTKPLILVTNDDGITAPGIRHLIKVMNTIGEVYVIAPDKPQSGMGHAITINSTLQCDPINIDNGPQKEWSCTGTPVDCVKIAVDKILPRKPDICVSGINHGSNSSINVIYSGTMSAAVEAGVEGIPAIGFSLLDYAYDANFEPALPFIKRITQFVLNERLPEGIVFNVNIPKVNHIKGIKFCRQAKAKWNEEFIERLDPRGRKYYWLTGYFVNLDNGDDTDEQALADNFISVVPVTFDLTNYDILARLKQVNLNTE